MQSTVFQSVLQGEVLHISTELFTLADDCSNMFTIKNGENAQFISLSWPMVQ